MSQIYTSNYFECPPGNLISISGDKGEDAHFTGKVLLALAPKRGFWKQWKHNIGKVPELENNLFYIREYYEQVLKNLDVLVLLQKEENPILLCYEKANEFCHRHIVAEYLYLQKGIVVPEIAMDEQQNVVVKERPKYIRDALKDVMSK